MSWITSFTVPQLFLDHMITPVIIRGKVVQDGFTVFGVLKTLLPGIGFVVTSSNNDYLLVDDFAYLRPKGSPISMDPSSPQSSIPDDFIFSPSLMTRLFWLLSGHRTKAKITGLEMKMGRLLDPVSEEDIGESWSVEQIFPILTPAMLTATGWPGTSIVTQDSEIPYDIKFLLHTSTHFPHPEGDMAPILPQISYQKEEHVAHRAWHIARAKWAQKYRPGQWIDVGGSIPHRIFYTFNEDVGIVTYRREIDGELHPVHHIYHVNGQPPSMPPSPAVPFVLGAPPQAWSLKESDDDSVDSMSPIAGGI
jgi:hypothetical protein